MTAMKYHPNKTYHPRSVAVHVAATPQKLGSTCGGNTPKAWQYMWRQHPKSVAVHVAATPQKRGSTCGGNTPKAWQYMWRQHPKSVALHVAATPQKRGSTRGGNTPKAWQYMWQQHPKAWQYTWQQHPRSVADPPGVQTFLVTEDHGRATSQNYSIPKSCLVVWHHQSSSRVWTIHIEYFVHDAT